MTCERKMLSIPENSTYVEKALYHTFLGQLYQALWENGYLLEVSTAEIDRWGYDVILSVGECTRHVQLKSGKSKKVNVHGSLVNKRNGCIVWLTYDTKSLEITGYYFFGSIIDQKFPDLSTYHKVKHLKKERKYAYSIPKSRFKKVDSIEEILMLLFEDIITNK